MNRRNFFSTLVKGVGVFSILPPAKTYSRIWQATREPVGIYEQLAACSSVSEFQSPVNLNALLAACYDMIKRKNARPVKLQSDWIIGP